LNKLSKIILHVGGDKTGSTTIQELFDHNRDLLTRQGYCYPPNLHHALFAAHFSEEPLSLDHFRVRRPVYDGLDVKAIAQAYVQALSCDLNEGNYHTLVLSYEGFLGLNTVEFGVLKQFLNQFSDNIEVIYYLRPHLSYAASAMSQRIRFGFPAWCQHPPVTYYMPRLKALSDAFGRQALSLKRFAKSDLEQGDIIIDFLAQLEIPSELVSQIERVSQVTNRSLSEEALLIGDAMIRLFMQVSGPNGVRFRNLFCDKLEQIKGRRYQLDKLQIDVIQRATQHDVELVLKQYGIDLGISNFDLLNYRKQEPALSEAKAYALARELIAQVLPEFVLPDSVPWSVCKENVIHKAEGEVILVNWPVKIEQAKYKVRVLIKNESQYWWGGNIAPVCVSYHWRDTSGRMVKIEKLRTLIPIVGIEPGGSAVVDMEFYRPELDGDYLLDITLLQEFYNWFEHIGLKPYRLFCRVKGGDLSVRFFYHITRYMYNVFKAFLKKLKRNG
jgi:hypothetical protein